MSPLVPSGCSRSVTPNNRINAAVGLLRQVEPFQSLLDVGCREGYLRKHLTPGTDYVGLDLVPCGPHVRYVGDVQSIRFDRRFDVVVALDVLEHMEHPSLAFDKLLGVADRVLIVSLPNCYDLKGRMNFALKGRLGGKYRFLEEEPLDRHHWVMGLGEIDTFFQVKARKHSLTYQIRRVGYGESGRGNLVSYLGRLVTRLLPGSVSTETVVGMFRPLGAASPLG